MPILPAPFIVQVGANAHSQSGAFSHDPVPWLIARGWAATLVEPQPGPANDLRQRYANNPDVHVVEAAICGDTSAASVPLYFINGSRTLGANESDVRCLGDVVSGTASFSKALVMAHQRFYRYTPSQCASCATRLGRQLPPTCMRRVYADNLDVLQVRCAHAGQLFGVNATGVDRQAPPGSVSLLVVDAEGEDDRVVARMLAILGGEAPSVLVYEQAHLRGSRRAALHSRLRAAGMSLYNRTGMRRAPKGSTLSPASWAQIRHVLARIEPRDNAAWVAGS